MRVLFVGTKRAVGAPRYNTVHVREVLRGLQTLGYQVSLIDGSWPCEPQTRPVSGKSSALRAAATALLPRLARLLAGIVLDLCTMVMAILRVAIVRRPVDVVYGRHRLLPWEWAISRVIRVPAVKEVNGIVAVESAIHGASGPETGLLAWFERFSMPRADRFITVTPELKDELVNRHRVDPEKVTVIGNGANTDLFRPMDRHVARNTLGLPDENSFVVFVGKLARWHSLEHLIGCAPAVLASRPDTRFLIVGDGPERERLKSLTHDLGVTEYFRFVGSVPYETVPLYCAAAEVCVVCLSPEFYLPRGASPLKLNEYLACGRPVVATRAPGFEFLEQVGAGVLVDPRDPEDLAQGLLRYLSDPVLAKNAGARGREHVVANASWVRVSGRVAQVLADAVAARERSAPPGCSSYRHTGVPRSASHSA